MQVNWQLNKQWEPTMNHANRERLLRDWRKAVTRSMGWLESDSEQSRSTKEELTGDTEGPNDIYTFSIGKKTAWSLIVAAVAGAALVTVKAGTFKKFLLVSRSRNAIILLNKLNVYSFAVK